MAEGTRGSDSDEAGGSDSDDDGGIGELGGGSDLNPMDSLLKKDIYDALHSTALTLRR